MKWLLFHYFCWPLIYQYRSDREDKRALRLSKYPLRIQSLLTFPTLLLLYLSCMVNSFLLYVYECVFFQPFSFPSTIGKHKRIVVMVVVVPFNVRASFSCLGRKTEFWPLSLIISYIIPQIPNYKCLPLSFAFYLCLLLTSVWQQI